MQTFSIKLAADRGHHLKSAHDAGICSQRIPHFVKTYPGGKGEHMKNYQVWAKCAIGGCASKK